MRIQRELLGSKSTPYLSIRPLPELRQLQLAHKFPRHEVKTRVAFQATSIRME
jgi:hypothetical protein